MQCNPAIAGEFAQQRNDQPMTPILIFLGFLVCAFMWGGIPAGGNIGATNVRRILGTRWFFGVLFLDAFKGAMPMFIALQILHFSNLERVIVAACVISGYLFSPWLGFKGGKGIGTSLGVLAVLAPIPLLVSIIVFAIILFASNYVSLASILAAIVFPIAIFLAELIRGVHHNLHLLVFSAVLTMAIIALHRSNLSKIADGTEHKFFA
jgi:glycerol-3-phosphate acyltransferase PlsY